MNYTDLITNFATRTLANLDLVKRAADAGDPGAFEITQLWNSLLGLIVAPRERDLTRLPETPVEQLHAEGWPDITVAGKLESEDLRGLVSTLRHAVAHFNVEFHANGDGEIQEVSLWNAGPGSAASGRPHRWDGRLTVDELERLARMIARTYIDNLGTRPALGTL
jgi:hypothetical protein